MNCASGHVVAELGCAERPLVFFCPGCRQLHGVWVHERNPLTQARWDWNGSLERPTFHPSILVTGSPASGRTPRVFRCHSFVRDGRIQFLEDSEHMLRGLTVELTPNPLEQT